MGQRANFSSELIFKCNASANIQEMAMQWQMYKKALIRGAKLSTIVAYSAFIGLKVSVQQFLPALGWWMMNGKTCAGEPARQERRR
jgi:hypothetical protein